MICRRCPSCNMLWPFRRHCVQQDSRDEVGAKETAGNIKSFSLEGSSGDAYFDKRRVLHFVKPSYQKTVDVQVSEFSRYARGYLGVAGSGRISPIAQWNRIR